jgi:DNA repair exonuclease SbcCD ATPase subunit
MALLKLYQTKGQKDSIAKYSLLAYEINQVIYQEMNSETLQRMQALYNYSRSQQTAEENKHKADTLRFWLIFAGTTVVLLTLLILWALNHYKNEQKAIKKQFADIQQEKSDLGELMSKNDSQHSTEIEEKEMTIKAMDAELQKYKKNKLYINIAAATAAINAAAIMKTFKKKAKGEGGTPSFDEWNELSQLVNEHLPHFIPALQERYPAICPAETEICLLVRLHFSNAQIATLLNRTESAVSKSKERLLEKVFPGVIGGAREFAQKLQVLG